MVKRDLSALREEYTRASLDEKSAGSNPLEQFNYWFEQALEVGLPEPNAMTLATVDQKGRPSARVVLLKELDPKGFVFYTNYSSRKGKDLDQNPHGALVFLWLELQRQVRVEGRVEKLEPAISDAYFNSRPRASRIAAVASPQSHPIPDRKFLEEKFREAEKQFGDQAVKRPEHWGGYRLIPENIEFWQGRQNRLHDRLLYSISDGHWKIQRLAP